MDRIALKINLRRLKRLELFIAQFLYLIEIFLIIASTYLKKNNLFRNDDGGYRTGLLNKGSCTPSVYDAAFQRVQSAFQLFVLYAQSAFIFSWFIVVSALSYCMYCK